MMEADLDLGDKLRATEKESSGDQLISKQYLSKKGNNLLYGSSMGDYGTKSKMDPVLQRPTTPGQLRQSMTSQAVDSIAQSFAKNQMYHSRSGGFENTLSPLAASPKDPLIDSLSASTNHRTSTDQRRSAKFTTTTTVQPNAAAELMRSLPLGKSSSPVKSSVDDDDDGDEPSPRSDSSASIHSSSSSIIDLTATGVNKEKASK